METGSAAGTDGAFPGGPTDLIAHRYGDALSFLDALSDAFGRPRFEERSGVVLSMPTGERFTGSYAAYADFLDVEGPDPGDPAGGLADRLDGDGSRAALSRLFGLVHGEVDDLREIVLHQVETNRPFGDRYLVFAVYLERMAPLLLAVMSDPLGEERDGAYYGQFSELVALLGHFVLFATGEKRQLDHGFVMDLARADHYARKRRGEPTGTDPDDRDFGAVRGELLREGALLAYDRGGVSADRCAELAGMSAVDFESLLVENGIEPRSGSEG